jgi:hypothetical protein
VKGVEAGATATCSYNSAPPQKIRRLNLSAIFSKTGKGVQEASGKTSHLSRADRAVLSAIDGKTALSEVQKNFEKMAGPKFEALIQQLDKDGFIREVSSGQSAAPTTRPAAPAAKAPPKAAPPADDGDDMDFTQAIKIPPRAPAPSAPKPPPVDLAAAARAESERKQKEEQALDFRSREQAEAKAKAEAEQKARAAAEARAKAEAESRARAEAEAKAREAAEAKSRAEAEAKSRAEADARTRAEADAKVKAAREAAVRMATEAKAKAEAEAKAKAEAAERDKARLEAELNAKLDAERKAREEAEKRAAEAAEVARKELEEKAKRDAEEMRLRLEAEMKAKLDAERKAREEEDRKRREEEDRRRKEEDERRAKEEAERRAREEAERKKREEEDRKRREEDERRRKEEDERRAKEEADRKKREEEDRKRREEEDRKRREDDERRALEDTNRRLETERRAKEDAERRAKEEAERKAKDEAERRAKQEADAKARAAADAAASLPKVDVVAPPPAAAAPAAGGGFGDSLLADLDSFGKREEEEQKAKEEAERKAKEEAARKAKEEADRRAREEAEAKRRAEEERRRKEEEERRAKEEEERKAQEEEERRKEEEAERKRKAKEAQAAKQAEERAAKAAATKGARPADDGDDIGVTEDDLDKDDLKRDQKVAAERARKAAREAPPIAVATGGRPKKWGKPAAIALFVLLLGGVAALNLMPLSTAEYEKAASDAMGVPVKISSARLSALAGIEVRLEGVTVGGAKISKVRGTPEVGSLFGARKAFSKVELEGLSISQAQLGDALLGKVAGENLRVARIVVKQLTLEGPLKLPALDVDATVAGDGTLQAVRLTGADKLTATLSPKGGDIAFELSAGSIALPFVPALSLSEFAMKGTANRAGIVSSEFDGRAYDGVISGTSRIRWGDSWTVEGELRARTLKVAVFAPTLVSEGRVEGRATYSMSGSTPATLFEGARMQGEFKIDKGVLGSFDLQRALQTSGNQSAGRTIFNELTAQGMYDKGTVQFTNVAISAGAMNAGAALTIDPSGNLSGRIVADVKTASQRQSATLNISGKLQDPVIRK